MENIEIAIDTSLKSHVIITYQELNQIKSLFKQYHSQQCVLVTNSTVEKYCFNKIEAYLHSVFKTVNSIIIPEGETQKNLTRVSHILDTFLDYNLERQDVVIALGGGVIGDLVGFAASIYKRGIPLIQIPTTLLAQVDASIGGKTGVNHKMGKNLIGTFYQPKMILSDISFLETLPKREWKCGLAEIIKYGVIRQASFFNYIESHIDCIKDFDIHQHHQIWLKLIKTSAQEKVDIVSRDEKESGLREILNFGHTFGHAIETHYGYGVILHGEAIATGMVMAGYLATLLGLFKLSELNRLESILTQLGFNLYLKDVLPMTLYHLFKHDKKVKQGICRFVLPTQMGTVIIKEIEDTEVILQAMSRYIK